VIRRRRLHMLAYMRSNDAFIGLPHDVFAFTMLQEVIARTLGVELGEYHHAVGSLHLYNRNRREARRYLKEGWQPTKAMPRMPPVDPWSAIRSVLTAERTIRCGRRMSIGALHPYWLDLVRLLQIYRHSKDRRSAAIMHLKGQMSVRLYDTYITDLANRVRRKGRNQYST
jgi:thymidylate synthase